MIAEAKHETNTVISGGDLLPDQEEIRTRITNTNPQAGRQMLSSLLSAWYEGAHLDKQGGVWLATRYLNQAIRLSAVADLNRFAPLAHNEKYIEDTQYLRGTKVDSLIREITRQLDDDDPIVDYLHSSRELYLLLRDCDEARGRRENYRSNFEGGKVELKQQRVRKLRLLNDEITNETLDLLTAEFVYIRCPATYPELAGHIHNGFVVNRQTGFDISEAGVLDERELFELCNRKGWKKTWYKYYRTNLLKDAELD